LVNVVVMNVVLVFVVVRNVVGVVVSVVAVSLSIFVVNVVVTVVSVVTLLVSVSVAMLVIVTVVAQSLVTVSVLTVVNVSMTVTVTVVTVANVSVTVTVVVVIRNVSLHVFHEFFLLIHVGLFGSIVGIFVRHVVLAVSIEVIGFSVLGSLVSGKAVHSVGMSLSIRSVLLQDGLSHRVVSDETVLLGVMSSMGGDEAVLLGVMNSVGGDMSVKGTLNTIDLAHDDTLSDESIIEFSTVAVNSVLNSGDSTLGHVVFVEEVFLLVSNGVGVIIDVVEHVVVVFDLRRDLTSLLFTSLVGFVVDQVSLGIFTLHVDLLADHLTVLGEDGVLAFVHFGVEVKNVHDLVEGGALLVEMAVDLGHG